jgi:hypothetical protein
MTVNHEGTSYQVTKTSYGNWDIERMSDNKRAHTTDSEMVDNLRADGTDQEYEDAVKRMLMLFECQHEPITSEQVENGFKKLIVTFIEAGFTKEQAIKEAELSLKNGDFEKMLREALMKAYTPEP